MKKIIFSFIAIIGLWIFLIPHSSVFAQENLPFFPGTKATYTWTIDWLSPKQAERFDVVGGLRSKEIVQFYENWYKSQKILYDLKKGDVAMGENDYYLDVSTQDKKYLEYCFLPSIIIEEGREWQGMVSFYMQMSDGQISKGMVGRALKPGEISYLGDTIVYITALLKDGCSSPFSDGGTTRINSNPTSTSFNSSDNWLISAYKMLVINPFTSFTLYLKNNLPIIKWFK